MTSSNTAVTRQEQVTALKATALDYPTVTSITTTATHVVMVVSNADEAIALHHKLLQDGWRGSSINGAQLSACKFIRIPILPK